MLRNTLMMSNTRDHYIVAKGIFLSILAVSSTIPFFLMVSEAAPGLAQPIVVETIDVGGQPLAIAYETPNERMYVGILGPIGSVSVIDTTLNEVVGDPIAADVGVPVGMAYNPDNRMMYVIVGKHY